MSTTSKARDRDAIAEALAGAAERGELTPTGTAVHGQQAAEAGRALLMGATGTSTPQEAARVALGRPRVGEERTQTRHWRLRVPVALDEAARAIAAREGLSVSEVVRRATATGLEVMSRSAS